ncbi:MAG: hypothetical protein ONB17_11375, partial [candidate division KSB1 bacterium]|nr:hypothetical protein [candidate division KSB1 bacterium]
DFFSPVSLNAYSYSGGNPVLNIDPKGTQEGSSANFSGSSEEQKTVRRILEKLAEILGVPYDELLAQIGQLASWAKSNAVPLGQLGGLLSAVSAVASAIAVAAMTGAASRSTARLLAAIVGAGSTVGALASALSTGILFSQGKMSAAQATFNIAVSGFGMWPGIGVRAVSGALRASSNAAMGRVVGWGLSRAWSMGSWVLGWR